MEGYAVPIDVTRHAAEIDVAPDHTTITYSHVAFTVRETFFATRCGPQDPAKASTGAIVALFTMDSIRPMTLTFNFTPEVRPMWPAPQFGQADPEWIPLNPHAPDGLVVPGWYMLHTDWPELSAAVAMPDTLPGILAPYQERPKFYPTQLILQFDPKSDRGKYFPLLMAVGRTPETATQAAWKLRSVRRTRRHWRSTTRPPTTTRISLTQA